uniref:PE family protein n=1 Tax=Mycobacterium riyadhense TaxID=486698 RepID=A0A653EKU1_9MYCO|nr:PE family protein [Mycobacterium riyadhense]
MPVPEPPALAVREAVWRALLELPLRRDAGRQRCHRLGWQPAAVGIDRGHNSAAAAPTTAVLAAGVDEVSAAIAVLFESHAQAYQAISAQVLAFHDQLFGR